MNVLPDAEQLKLDDAMWERACLAAQDHRVGDKDLLNAQRVLAKAGRWDGVYVLSVIAGLETSVLIDADEKIFIDWGTAGQVTLQPPVGGRLPFKLWVHTPSVCLLLEHDRHQQSQPGCRHFGDRYGLGPTGSKAQHQPCTC